MTRTQGGSANLSGESGVVHSVQTMSVNNGASRLKKRRKTAKLDVRSLLNNGLEKRLLAVIRLGCAIETCCDYVNLGRQTYYDWIKRGTNDPDSRYGLFTQRVQQ